ncbi:hypothetical protein CSE16_09430 [Solibacillus sp. R5-41]|uniref:hypothetical protein n=1 Tax=Solibacillus sp. R5-41 TaxID=2048654 RepID=UPI000C12561A|nr:hypothetical protein [Solibacillus sp. R5-41]ATP40246.1 hypothetical protein CSE16_09430 [Solibacillus sp. R5-41]
MKKERVFSQSMFFGLILSGIVSSALLFLSRFFAGGVMNFREDIWMYIIFAPAFAIGFGVLGLYLYNHPNRSNQQMWEITAISVIAMAMFSGTVGMAISEVISHGFEGANLFGQILWGFMCALFSLPITIPLGKLIVEVLAEFVGSMKIRML